MVSTAIWIAASLALCAPWALGQTVKPKPKTPVVQKRPPAGSAIKAAGPQIATILPQAINAQESARYGEILGLADAQQVFLERQFQEYQKAVTELLNQQMPGLNRLAQEAFAAAASTEPDEFINKCERCHARERSIAASLFALDEQFLSAVSSVLSEPQQSAMERVRLRRQRSRCMMLNTCRLRGAAIDVTVLLDQFRAGHDALVAADEALRIYEADATTAMARLDKALLDDRGKFERLDAELRSIWSSGGGSAAAGAKAIQEKRAKIMAATAKLQRRMADVNDDHVHRVAQALGPEAGDALRRTYLQQCFPTLYPDVLDPEPLLTRLAQLPELDEDQRAVLAELRDAYRYEYRVVCSRMENRFKDWVERWLSEPAYLAEEYPEYQQAMRALRERRWTVDEQLIDNARNVLPSELIEVEVQQWINQFEAMAQQTRKNAARDGFPGQ